MKSVLISIQPKWCELIASGKKTVEVRKTKPKLDTPFKCYIYCTNTRTIGDIILCKSDKNAKLFGYNTVKGINKGFAEKEDVQLKGKVIGEFICDEITGGFWIAPFADYLQSQSCLSYDEVCDYANGKPIFAWHISNLVIYDKPRELREFKKINRDCWYADLGLAKRDCPECKNADCFLQKPPQSWCYVESEVDTERPIEIG